MSSGYVYIMVNPALQDMVKIGYATDVEVRRQQLSTTALPYDYRVYATYATSGNLEDKKLHKLIDKLNPDLRVSKNREFYFMSAEDAYNLVETIAQISGTESNLTRWESTSSKTTQISTDTKISICIPDGKYYLNWFKHSEDKRLHVIAEITDGCWTLLKGSVVATTHTKYIQGKTRELFDSLPKDSDGCLTEDTILGQIAPSTASSLVIGSLSNGWIDWRTEDGQSIDIFRRTTATTQSSNNFTNHKSGKESIPNGIYSLVRYKATEDRTIDAKVSINNGNWTLLKGSKIAMTRTTTPKPPQIVDRFRANLTNYDTVTGCVLEDTDLGACSPGFAAGVVMWSDAAGWYYWKTEDDQPIDIFRH